MLQSSDGQTAHALKLSEIESIIEAWQRQIPDLLCPLKIEDGKIYRHERVYRDEMPAGFPGREKLPMFWIEWREDTEGPTERWENLAYDVNVVPSEMQRIPGVVFLGMIEGKHHCRPATEAEINQRSEKPVHP